jgi:hypothetical protein
MLDSSEDNHDDNKDFKLDDDAPSNDDNKDNINKEDNANQACGIHFNDKPSQEEDETDNQGVHRSRCKE